MAVSEPAVQEFVVTDLDFHSVTVYRDRAEVKRIVKAVLKRGTNEVLVKSLPATVDSECIRVEGEGVGVICEVQYQTKFQDAKEQDGHHRKELQQKIKDIKSRIKQNQNVARGITCKREVLEGVAGQVAGGHPKTNSEQKPSGVLTMSALGINSFEGLDSFLEYYEKSVTALDVQAIAHEEELKGLEEELQVANLNMSQLGGSRRSAVPSREVSVMLESAEAGEAVLTLSYMVLDAGWTPSYDVRVFSEKKTMKILYYGMVRQMSGEEWANTKLFLSTATPSVGGDIPELDTTRCSFIPEVRHMGKAKMQRMMDDGCAYATPRGGSLFGATVTQHNESLMTFGSNSDNGSGTPPRAMAMAIAETMVKEGVLNATFEVSRPTTIPSDSTYHKVNVAVIDLKPNMEYVTVPQKSSSAYLKAVVGNESSYPLLAGPISVFLDNNFIAKSKLKNVSPKEEFSCSLGVDPGMRVDQKPLEKFHEESGMFGKVSITNYVQKTTIKNTRQTPLKITLFHPIPLSTDEKIKVTLLQPQLGKHCTMNKDNNLEWVMEMKAGEEISADIKYSIEAPKGKETYIH